MKLDNLGLILGSFIIILLGIVLLNSLSDSIYAATTISNRVNETIAIASGAGQTAEDDVVGVSLFGFANVTGTNLVNYNWTRAGVITAYPINFTNGNANISYTFEGTEYLTNSTSRTIIKLIQIFFALAIVIVGFVLVKKGFENMF